MCGRPKVGSSSNPASAKQTGLNEMDHAVGGQLAGQQPVQRRRPDIVQRGEHGDAKDRTTVQDERAANPFGVSSQLRHCVRPTSHEDRRLMWEWLDPDKVAKVWQARNV